MARIQSPANLSTIFLLSLKATFPPINSLWVSCFSSDEYGITRCEMQSKWLTKSLLKGKTYVWFVVYSVGVYTSCYTVLKSSEFRHNKITVRGTISSSLCHQKYNFSESDASNKTQMAETCFCSWGRIPTQSRSGLKTSKHIVGVTESVSLWSFPCYSAKPIIGFAIQESDCVGFIDFCISWN